MYLFPSYPTLITRRRQRVGISRLTEKGCTSTAGGLTQNFCRVHVVAVTFLGDSVFGVTVGLTVVVTSTSRQVAVQHVC